MTMGSEPTETEETDNHETIIDRNVIADARKLAKEIHHSADVLLERLLSHLSQFPEFPAASEGDNDEDQEEGNARMGESSNVNDDEEETMMLKRGLTIPVSAVAWLSDQLEVLNRIQQQQHTPELELAASETAYQEEKDEAESKPSDRQHACDLEPWLGSEVATSLRYRLNLLRFLLPRAQLIRLTRQSWPPRSSSDVPTFFCTTSPKQKLKQWWKKRQRRTGEDETAATEARASDFLRYVRRFEHGAYNCVDLWRVFPDATVLILESVPPSWIYLKGRVTKPASVRNQKQPGLRLLSVSDAAIYDLKDFFPPISTSLQIPASQSLTHLKLDHCSLGELTKGFSSSLSQLVHLEYLSLSHNQFRSAKTLLKGLRPLTKLRYLNVSANQLMGCFGPYANLCLGGQLRTLKLSDNLLETCRNSGLEKCYGLTEIWLDSNNIQDVVEVSGLARLPDLQCLALQRNPFSQRHDASGQQNFLFDPTWKIRLWTWFQHERRALTPLELPLLNKKTKHFGCNAATIGRMTKEEWDRIQEESYTTASVATTSTMTAPTISSSLGESMEESEIAAITPETTVPIRMLEPVRNRKVTKKSKTRQAKIYTSDHKSHTNVGKQKRGEKIRQRKSKKLLLENKNNVHDKDSLPKAAKKSPIHSSELNIQQLSFSLQDVLVSLHHEHLQQHPRPTETESETQADILDENEIDESKHENSVKEAPTPKEASDKCVAENDVPNNPFLEDDASEEKVDPKDDDSKEAEGEKCEEEKASKESEEDCDAKEQESSKIIPLPTEEVASESINVPNEEKEKSNESEDLEKSKASEDSPKKERAKSSSTSSPKRIPKRSPKRSPRRTTRRQPVIDEDRIFVRPKVSSTKLNRMGNYKPFDALSSDWDDVIKKASEGRIPDGLLKSPVDESSNDFGMSADVFSDDAADLLDNVESNNPAVAKSADQTSESRSTKDPTVDPSLSSKLANSLPEHVWQDDDSCLSSLGASRDDIPKRVNKFQLAEENCSYDGPDSSRGMKVVENKQMYFEQFVFPTSVPDLPENVLEEMEEDQEDWQLIAMYYPRIQLWPDDRRLLELERVRISSSMHRADWTTNRERFLRVWEEDLVPCGKPAMRRLPPNRKHRLGFHGDKLFVNSADVDAYAECRKVLLCLSSKAFYVIPEKDDVTMRHKQQSNKRTFPLPLDPADRFRDAPWPHAVARHGLEQLEAICIGFEFQRLTLRFRNPSLPKSDPFVYVLLTGDKRASVRILQEIQKLAKDLSDNYGVSNLDKNSSTIDIENDSHIVLDSLNSLSDLQGQSIGTIMHFQIVHQQWKHGDRGTVRRVCVITDTKILLLDEDYAADGHDISSVTIKGKNMADARYRLVDHAQLSLVSQVQAANTDPRSITIIINPSALSRTKRWRLVCRDREGAERLVDDARRAREDI